MGVAYDSWPTLEARLNDTLSYAFIFDTGSPVLMLGTAPVQALGLVPTDSAKVGDYYGHSQHIPVYNLKTLQLGPLTYSDVAGMQVSHPVLNAVARGGIVGLNSFSQGVLELDFVADSLRYSSTRRGVAPLRNGHNVACRYQWPARSLVLPLELAGSRVGVKLDTGDPEALSITDSLARAALLRRYPAQLHYGIKGGGLFGQARPDTFAVVVLDTLWLGPSLYVRNVPCEVSRTGSNTLGMALLNHFQLQIGLSKKHIRFSAPPSDIQQRGLPALPDHQLPLQLAWNDSTCTVRSYTLGGIAHQAGIQLGDTVVAIAGHHLPAGATPPLAVLAASTLLRSAPAEVAITVLRAGQPTQFQMGRETPQWVPAGTWVR
jgi:hypothetical protein